MHKCSFEEETRLPGKTCKPAYIKWINLKNRVFYFCLDHFHLVSSVVIDFERIDESTSEPVYRVLKRDSPEEN